MLFYNKTFKVITANIVLYVKQLDSMVESEHIIPDYLRYLSILVVLSSFLAAVVFLHYISQRSTVHQSEWMGCI